MGMNEKTYKFLKEGLTLDNDFEVLSKETIQQIVSCHEQLQAYKDKEDKLRELIVEPCANVLGHDVLQILDGSDK